MPSMAVDYWHWASVGTGSTLQYAAVSGGDIVSYTGATVDNTGVLSSMTSGTTNYTSSTGIITLAQTPRATPCVGAV